MFREVNHTRTEAIIDLIRTLPESEQSVIVNSLTAASKPKKKLNKKQAKKKEILEGIAEGLREIKEAKRGGKQLMDLEDALNEL